jgi:hypothetical protein
MGEVRARGAAADMASGGSFCFLDLDIFSTSSHTARDTGGLSMVGWGSKQPHHDDCEAS